jgi:hypothetical protein
MPAYYRFIRIWSLEVSDNLKNNFISGNFAGRCHRDGHGDGCISLYTRRPLVEECEGISISDLRNRFKRKELLSLAEREQPIRVRCENRHYEIMMSAESYQQKWRRSGWSDITRIWLLCSCGRRARRLYVDPRPFDTAPTLACRTCHRLRYLSQNSGKTKWFHRIARPIKKLIQRQEKLLMRKRTQLVQEELDFIEGQIFILTQRAKSKRRARPLSGIRRRYKNLGLVIRARPTLRAILKSSQFPQVDALILDESHS